jgi:diguanylate cyclase (GGDEF)-like protein/PAS domain S-box-containing protein
MFVAAIGGDCYQLVVTAAPSRRNHSSTDIGLPIPIEMRSNGIAAFEHVSKRARWLLPSGNTLAKRDWAARHRVLQWILWLHAIALFALGLAHGYGLAHSVADVATLLPCAYLAWTDRIPRRARSVAASLGLLTASAVLVHLFDGAIEAHFHFFVMIAVIALYQDWLPFLIALLFVVFEHGLGGLLVPSAVYNHADAIADPWTWAGIHAVFVLMASAAQVAHWKLSEINQSQRERSLRDLRENQRTLATLMSNLPGMAYRCLNDERWTSEFVSEGCFELTGYTQQDFTSGRVSYADLTHSEDRERVRIETQAAVDERQPFQFTYRINTADGWERWVWEQGRGVYDENGTIQALEGFIADVTERRQAEEALAYQAQHDMLTDLPNRVWLRHELQESLRSAKHSALPVALLVMDVDHFKEVNDTFGHRWGDVVLQQVAQRLQASLSSRALLARLGADEFGVLLPRADTCEAPDVANLILRAFEAPFLLADQSVFLGASIGIAQFPEHGADAETLMRRADMAMYVAKSEGSGFVLYSADQDQDEHSRDRLTLMSELRKGLDTGQLVLHYQPIVDCALGRITSVEALVRWNHPERGLVPPDEFIPLAEQSGLIKPLTVQVLQMALRQCQIWAERSVDLTMCVNLSMRNLHDPHLPDLIERMLRDARVPAERLKLEITESTIMQDASRAMEVLDRLRRLGTAIAIDDFGTGYSSLAYLKRLPVDFLKIDKSFVRKLASDASDRAIVRSAVELGHNLGLRVVAEGVEDPASFQQLAALGCDLVQGYYMGRPVPAQALDHWLDDSVWGLRHLPHAA